MKKKKHKNSLVIYNKINVRTNHDESDSTGVLQLIFPFRMCSCGKKATERNDRKENTMGAPYYYYQQTLAKCVEEINIHANAAAHIEKSERHDENRKLILT